MGANHQALLMAGAGSSPNPDTLLLCNFDATNGDQSFLDESMYARTLTGNSNCQLSSTRSPFGGTSLKINKQNNGAIITADVASLALGANEPFTMETTVYYVSSTAFAQSPLLMLWGRGAIYDELRNFSSSAKFAYNSEQFGDQEPSPIAYTANAWVHVAITYDGTNIKRWVDGSLVFTTARTFGASVSGAIQLAGAVGSSGSPDATEVYMGPTRFSRGCLYTTTFTPPSANFTS